MSNILGNMPPVFGSGYRGVVPAPTAADVSAQNILRADGTWGAGPSGTLPSQTGNAGELLTTDGTNASWASSLNTFQFGDVTLGTSGPSVKSTLSARAPRQGLVFDGTNKATVSVPAFGTSDFTIDAVANTDNAGAPNYIVAGATGCFSALSLGGGELYFFKGGGDARTVSSVFTSKKTVRIAISKASGVIKTYINGVLVDTWTDTNDATGGYTQPITGIGGISTQYWAGYLSVNVYNRALSASEVVALYEAGAPAGADYNSASNTAINTVAWNNGGIVPFDSFSSTSTSITYTESTSTEANCILPVDLSAAPVGSRFLITYDYTFTGSAMSLYMAAGAFGPQSPTVTLQSGTSNSFIFTKGAAGGSGAQNYFVIGKQGLTGTNTGTISNISIKRLGLLLAPDAAQAGGGLTWYDTSGNAANITLPASGVSWNVPSSRVLGGNWSATGNFLIGTSTASGVLTINKAASDTLSAANAAAFIGQPDTFQVGLLMQQTLSAPYSFALQVTRPNGAAQFPLTLNPSGGNVLIGTTTDGGQKLQVSGGARFNFATNTNITLSGSGTISTIASLNDALNTYEPLFLNSSTLVFNTNGVEAARFDSSQNATFAGMIKLGGTTSSYPALKRGSEYVEFKLADDSAYAPITALRYTLKDGVTAPSSVSGFAFLYVDTADGSLKVKFGNGTTKTIATNP